ncbi:GPW/gp25 family protein [Deminuibacter soli]|uniref:IraD/Gp25-like domain-containing protein n=1 Tax=Deminuibacter soli TaxID=2291815 RepID=A0A3E1NGH0_9BACT|nr:GPW/gp25 family protein [Deminuibacter soli]RFM26941.1 hypothetical protein DXN05_18325 [Deminuibacter soli]
MNVKFTYQFSGQGRTASTDNDGHIRDMIEQLLFTNPGERLNRPSFGGALNQLVFQPNSDELAATTQFLVQGALQQWLGDLIEVNAVQVTNDDALLKVIVAYTVRTTQQNFIEQFTR